MILLVTGFTFDALLTRPLEQKVESAETSLSSSSRILSRKILKSNPAEQLAEFYSFFDQPNGITNWLERIYFLAHESGIELSQADYQLIQPKNIPLNTYIVSLPLHGEFDRINEFSQKVLADIPVAALDHISFNRERTDQLQIKADMQFTLYVPVRP